MIVDTHAHLDHLENLDLALENARQAHVTTIAAMSMNLASCQRNLEIKKSITSPQICLAMGIHPAEAKREELEPCVALIKANVQHLHAIGEIGLDFWYKWVRKDKEKHAEQRDVFRRLLDVAKELDLPAIVHSRGTWRECFETVKEVGLKRAVFHWYSGPLDVLDDIVNYGYFVSASPSLAYSSPSRQAIARAPIGNVLIETDCPVYFSIPTTGEGTPEEGFKSEPKDVWRTLRAYAQLMSMDEDKAAHILHENAKAFFNLK